MTVKVPFGGGQPLEHAWPEVLDPRDVHAGDELVVLPGRWESHRDFGGPQALERARWTALDERFCVLFPRVLCGRASPAELEAVARAMGLCHPPRHDARHTNPFKVPVDDALLADIAENYVPEVGPLAMSRVLGPFADLRPPRRWRVVAAGVLAFTRLVAPAERPIDRYAEDKPRPSPALREAIRAVALAPPMLWRVHGGPDGGLHPMLPLAPGFQPRTRSSTSSAPAILGRLVPDPDGGERLFLALPLPILPDPAPVLRRLTWELWRVRRHELRVTWEDMLRERGEVLYRAVLEQVWDRTVGEEGQQAAQVLR